MVTINNIIRSIEASGTLKHEAEYKGLHADSKPTDCLENSLFLELDTGDVYYFASNSWSKVGA